MKNPPSLMFKTKPAQLIKWHRRAGLAAALFVLILAITGLLLNHTTELRLDQRHIGSNVILNWYGMDVPDTLRHFRAGDTAVSQLGEQLFIDAQRVMKSEDELVGAAAHPMFIAAALEGEILLLTASGELVERIRPLPQGLTRLTAIGTTPDGRIAIAADETTLVADTDLLTWQPAPADQVITWSRPAQAGEAFNAQVIDQYLGQTLSYERVLLDLHSGRLFGGWGVYLMDAAAILLILLALTGLWRWAQQTRRLG